MPDTRAVLRTVEAGTLDLCGDCGARVKFAARSKARKVVANVYQDGRWDRVEHFHEDCYDRIGRPYGEPDDAGMGRRYSSTASGSTA